MREGRNFEFLFRREIVFASASRLIGNGLTQRTIPIEQTLIRSDPVDIPSSFQFLT